MLLSLRHRRMGVADAMLSKLLSKDVRTNYGNLSAFRQLVYRTILRSSTFRHTTLHGLDLPIASVHYKLEDDFGLDIRVILVRLPRLLLLPVGL